MRKLDGQGDPGSRPELLDLSWPIADSIKPKTSPLKVLS
jgi:hypothetical protein